MQDTGPGASMNEQVQLLLIFAKYASDVEGAGATLYSSALQVFLCKLYALACKSEHPAAC